MYTDEDKLNEVVDIDKTLNLIDFLSKTKGKKRGSIILDKNVLDIT